MVTATVQVHQWTREEYEKMTSLGVFDPEARLELVDGEILHMSPQSSRHATAILGMEEGLRHLISQANYHVRTQLPLALTENSEPEPDIAVVRGSFRCYRDHHPRDADLVVEVSDTSLEYDQGRKQRLYARAGISEYWILDLNRSVLEVYRQPTGERYTDMQTLTSDDSVQTLIDPDTSIRVADLLP